MKNIARGNSSLISVQISSTVATTSVPTRIR